jgi:trk system potassium uptake protein TrkA
MRVILMGGDKTVYFLAREFVSKGYELAVINRAADESAALARQFHNTLVIHGDGSDPHIQEEAGVRQADIFLALTPHDEDNLIACQIAQQMFGVPRTLAMVNDPDNEAVFRQLGVSAVFSTSRIVALLIEEQAGFDEITNLFPMADGRVAVAEVTLTANAPANGQSLAELRLPQASLIGGILRQDEFIVPHGDSRLQAGDRLILISGPDDYGDAVRILVGDEA